MDLREIRTVLDKLMANLLPNTETRIAAEAPNIARFVHPNKSGRYETTEGETIMEFG
ncbi:MAG TPA: hypothetical protein PK765_06955 [bacterium]|nr:hypothetical protein [bacterium]